MKKLNVVIAVLIAVAVALLIAQPKQGDVETYTAECRVTAPNTFVLLDSGDAFKQDLALNVNDVFTAKMSDNGTPNNLEDDHLVEIL